MFVLAVMTSGPDAAVAGPAPGGAPQSDEESHKLTSLEGLAALSLDALSSVAYGPQAIIIVLAAAGAAALHYTLPVTLAIVLLLSVLVISYRQVIEAFPNGGGAYAVAKAHLGVKPSLIAAASLVVDYILNAAVGVSAGVEAMTSAFPSLFKYRVLLCLIVLAAITAANLWGVAESARLFIAPTIIFIAAIFAVIIGGLLRTHPLPFPPGTASSPTATVGVLLLLKAFASGSVALTGVEAIANAVPAFRSPSVKRAQHTEIALGFLLGAMLLGLAIQIRLHEVVPRGNVTVLAQLSAGAFGTGWPFYLINLSVTLVLAFAANTSFGGLPTLMQLLAKDHRLPHMFALRAEKPVFRYGVTALALLSAVVLLIVDADTQRLLPVFAIGVFIGFTISQTGLVVHWRRERGPRWLGYILLNGFGAVLTAIAGIVLFASKFTEGAWLLMILVPGLIILFNGIERYYGRAAEQLGLGKMPAKPVPGVDPKALVIVPIVAVSSVAQRALQVAMRVGPEVVPITVDVDPDATARLRKAWNEWDPGIDLKVLDSPHRSLVSPTVHYVRDQIEQGRHVTVLLAQVEPRRWRHKLLYNQRGPILATALRLRTKALVATLGIPID